MESLKRDLQYSPRKTLSFGCFLNLHDYFPQILHRELVEMQERYKLQSKELKDAVSQRKMAMGEFAEVNDRLSEMRTAKQGLSRQVRNGMTGL